ncbi:MAG: hypothetical protein EXR62_03105 [Chloroflexi bacterium]|nr:hypothetical protein [Chloroflexota bacterium]
MDEVKINLAQDLLVAFLAGIGTMSSPCALPLYPGFLAFLGGQKSHNSYLLGFWVLLGVLVMMLCLGAIMAALSLAVTRVVSIILPLADVLIMLLGMLLLLDINLFQRLPSGFLPPVTASMAGNRNLSAFIYGLLYGPIALPCSGAFIVSIFALSTGMQEFGARLLLFLVFGLGFGLPLLFLSLLAGGTQRQLTRWLAQHATWINRVAGVILLIAGILDLRSNWELLSLYLA